MRLVDQSLRKMQALRVRNSKRRCAKMLRKQSPQMAARHAEPVGEVFNRTVVQSAI